jgi:hypothetical protein
MDPSGAAPVEYTLAARPIDMADFIPVRLMMPQRKLQRLIRGVLLTSSYTDKVDVESKLTRTAAHRNMTVVKEVHKALGGLCLCLDLHEGAHVINDGDFKSHEKDIQSAIEIARRYKIMNPDLLRTDYVKFLYMVQDATQSKDCADFLGFPVVTPIVTVGGQAKELGVEDLLKDPRLPLCITPVPKIRSRTELNKALRYKDVMVSKLCKEWASKSGGRATVDDIELLVRSLNDFNTFTDANVESTKALMHLLKKHFKPNAAPEDARFSLAIREGERGSRLTHEHERQYTFVLQSLALWKNISNRMFELWMIAEGDLLAPDVPYELRNTGQGLQRVQPAPNLYKVLSEILSETKRELGAWVGSDRIHMGDNQVPNAFHFIDKYAQISRIIIPVLKVVEMLEDDELSPNIKEYVVSVFGTVEQAQRVVLADLFRSAFDGSGGDNMDDAGSCIDGRLTSAWNWCNQIRVKPFYPLFMLAGFSSFDGDLTL